MVGKGRRGSVGAVWARQGLPRQGHARALPLHVRRIGRFGSHDEAAAARVAKALDADSECSAVHAERHEDGEGRVSTCFGVALGGAKGEARFLPIIPAIKTKRALLPPSHKPIIMRAP